MNASAAIADPLLRRAFGLQARPSYPQRTARVRFGSSRLRAQVSRRGSAISQRTVMNNVGQASFGIDVSRNYTYGENAIIYHYRTHQAGENAQQHDVESHP